MRELTPKSTRQKQDVGEINEIQNAIEPKRGKQRLEVKQAAQKTYQNKTGSDNSGWPVRDIKTSETWEYKID